MSLKSWDKVKEMNEIVIKDDMLLYLCELITNCDLTEEYNLKYCKKEVKKLYGKELHLIAIKNNLKGLALQSSSDKEIVKVITDIKTIKRDDNFLPKYSSIIRQTFTIVDLFYKEQSFHEQEDEIDYDIKEYIDFYNELAELLNSMLIIYKDIFNNRCKENYKTKFKLTYDIIMNNKKCTKINIDNIKVVDSYDIVD